MKSYLKRLRDGDKTLVKMDFLNDEGRNYSVASDQDAREISAALRTNNSLTDLNLYYHGITDVGAGYFADAIGVNKTLKRLNLAQGNIKAEGARLLAVALKSNNTLEYFNLGFNTIGDEGIIHFAGTISVNTGLKQLELLCTGITGEVANAFLKALDNNLTLTKINLSQNYGIPAELRNQINERLQENIKISESGVLQLIPVADCQKVATNMISKIVPALPVTVTAIVSEYDGAAFMLSRVSKKMKPGVENKLDDIMKILHDGGVSDVASRNLKPSASPTNTTSTPVQKPSEATKLNPAF